MEREVFVFVMVLFAIYRIMSPIGCGENAAVAKLKNKLKRDLLRLRALKVQNSKLQQMLAILNLGPKKKYENLRRRIHSNTKELWYYVYHELEVAASKMFTADQKQILLKEVANRKRSLLSDQEKLPALDGYEEWRRQEAASISDLVQRRLRYLQNPSDCNNAGIVVCNNDQKCGFSCQVHDNLINCLIFAYATERTLLMNDWNFDRFGWESIFHPISDNCTSENANDEDGMFIFSEANLNARVGILSVNILSQRPKFLPLTIPDDLAHRIIQFNGDPSSWWVGQLLKYILRPNEFVQAALNNSFNHMEIKSPIVGVHVRRMGAKYHDISEYMSHVDDYYAQLKLTRAVDVRRVYLATDDARLLEDASLKYPQYEFSSNLNKEEMLEATNLNHRFLPTSLRGLLVDLHILARCDYMVCTFSSLFSKMAYEMMQSNRVDASDSVISLDDIYSFPGEGRRHRVAIIANKGGHQDIAFDVGDIIEVASNNWNGYGRGTNNKTIAIDDTV